MIVHVVVGNDFPDRVYADESAAEKFISEKNAENTGRVREGRGIIYWRVWSFEVLGLRMATVEEIAEVLERDDAEPSLKHRARAIHVLIYGPDAQARQREASHDGSPEREGAAPDPAREKTRVWHDPEWTCLWVDDGVAQATLSLTKSEAFTLAMVLLGAEADSLETTGKMLGRYADDCFPPPNEHGQVAFGKIMMDSAALEILSLFHPIRELCAHEWDEQAGCCSKCGAAIESRAALSQITRSEDGA